MLIRLHPRSLLGNVLAGVYFALHPARTIGKELFRAYPLPTRSMRLYRETLDFLQDSEHWSAEQHRAYQLEQLRLLLRHANAHVPYYCQLFQHIDFDPGQFDRLEDIRKLPFMDRDTIENNRSKLLSGATPGRDRVYYTTGGSTGIPLGFYLDRTIEPRREAFFNRMWSALGYRPFEHGIILRGRVVNSSRPRALFTYDFFDNKVFASSYHLAGWSAPRLHKLFCQFQPTSIQAYPSAISLLAQYMLQQKLPPIPSVRLILCGSENLYEWQREILSRAFGCRVLSWYGHSENVLLAGECEFSSEYHCYSEHGLLELIRPDGSVIENEGEVGEIVGTGFLNYTMPFIRYRTGDRAAWASGPCPCGRSYRRLKRIEGRLQELIVSGNGRRVSMTAINMHSNLFDNVRQFQFEQYEPGKVELKLIRKSGFTDSDSFRIRKEMEHKLGDDLRLELKYVTDIPPTRLGKHRFLIQHLPLDQCD